LFELPILQVNTPVARYLADRGITILPPASLRS
jgi:hypothetical protein